MAGKAGKKQVTLTQALAQLLGKTLLPDLQARAKHPAVDAALQRQWQAEKAALRTADGFPAWQERTLEQVGAAWVLSCVFVRTLEDRDLLARRRLAGPGALDSEQLFFELSPSLTARDYLLTVFKEVASLPGAEELLGPRHNPLWRLSPSNEAARALLDFFRQEDAEQGRLVWGFAGTDARFLGDLYQDLSADVRDRYALWQTPDFVERFILEQTLDPAIAEFGLETVRVIDPTCGSGHFLLGAFDRLLSLRQQAAPAVDVRDHAVAALGQVYGVDVNPYAVAIARFRLTLAYLQRAGITKLALAPRLPLNLVVADSLLHGAKDTSLLFVEHKLAAGNYKAWDAEMFALDDPQAAGRVFGQRYHAVVGNPPYITCKDSVLREVYRQRYQSAAGKYALSAPFTERFFDLAVDNGFVGMINANSFMKREFGKTLIEEVFPQVDLTSVIDTSGTSIPGHTTPTVLIFGRNRKSAAETVHAILSKRGEPGTPDDPEQGLVWRSIVDHRQEIGFENEYISIAEMARAKFHKHPWSLGGGGAAELKQLLEERAEKRLGEVADSIGFMAITGEDDIFSRPLGAWLRGGAEEAWLFDFGVGENIRDWWISANEKVFFPYRDASLRDPSEYPGTARALWPWRRTLLNRPDFGGKKYLDVGRPWFSLHQVPLERLKKPMSIAFAFVSTHNHFVLDRGTKVFKQSAPIIKLQESASENDHFALLAYLNSSTACFYARQVMSPKGMNNGSRANSTPFLVRYEWDGTKLKLLPLPKLDGTLGLRLVELGRTIERLAQARNSFSLEKHLKECAELSLAPDFGSVVAKRVEVVTKAAAVQEEIDWVVYKMFDLVPASAVTDRGADLEMIQPGNRAFELLLSERDPASFESGWFKWNEYSPTTDRVSTTETVRHRLYLCETIGQLALLENPTCKRRWVQPKGKAAQELETDDKILRDQIQAWFHDLLEGEVRCHHRIVRARAVAQIVAHARFVSEASDWAKLGSDLENLLVSFLLEQSVPFAPALYLSENGMSRLSEWRKTWHAQAAEDRGETETAPQVPPYFEPKDFLAHCFSLRGSLNVPNERFISYPGCEKDGDPSPLIGWAGWNHLQRAQALVALYQERKNEDGWPKERLMPMLVGLHELMFWLEQWHSQPEAGSQNPAREFKQFLDAELHAHALTTDDLEAWRPPARTAKRAARKTAQAENTDAAGTTPSDTPKRSRRRKADVSNETP